MKKHWIFDWSGTVVDDLGLVVWSTNYVLGKYGKSELSREEFRKSFCLPYADFYKQYVPEGDMLEVEAHFREGFAISDVAVTVLPYAREFLEQLKSRGCKLYVLSSMCAKAFSEQVVELEMDQYFEETCAGVLDKREVILEMMQRHGMGQDNTVFVGDMTHDVETAHHAGIMSLGVLTGYNHSAALAASEPTMMVKDLSVVAQMLGEPLRNTDVTDAGSDYGLVKIRGLELATFIGVPDTERAQSQVLRVNLDMTPTMKFSEMGDEIDGGVDYYQVSLRLEELALDKPRKLIETLAVDLANAVLAEFPVSRVRMEIEKFIMPNTRHVGVELVIP